MPVLTDEQIQQIAKLAGDEIARLFYPGISKDVMSLAAAEAIANRLKVERDSNGI